MTHTRRSISHPRLLDSGNAALFEKPPDEFLEHNTEGIDWERVASTVSIPLPFEYGSTILNDWSILKMTSRNRAHGSRTARECEIKWLGDRHPSINHAQWSQPEIRKCRELVDAYREEHGHGMTIDWVWIANELKVTYDKSLKQETGFVHSHSDKQDPFGLYATWDSS